MPRAATTSDVFNAIAEPQRRRILSLLREREHTVGAISHSLGLAQPTTSKHLKVLKEVGLVDVETHGRQRLYRLDARGLREVHEWTGGFERFWEGTFDRLETYARDLERKEREDGTTPHSPRP
ncbi:MAG TPA: metalloregulator ArsR/SmtB family transcription factor [Acidimicrobiia bacterium]